MKTEDITAGFEVLVVARMGLAFCRVVASCSLVVV
jgi:hypothetical protein